MAGGELGEGSSGLIGFSRAHGAFGGVVGRVHRDGVAFQKYGARKPQRSCKKIATTPRNTVMRKPFASIAQHLFHSK